jgi:hypothetical protein
MQELCPTFSSETLSAYRENCIYLNVQTSWVSGPFPLSGILENFRKHNISETGYFSIFRLGEGDMKIVGSLRKS